MGMCEIVCHQLAFRNPIYWDQRAREAGKRVEGAVVLEYALVGRPDNGEGFERGLYHHTFVMTDQKQRVNFLDIQLGGR